MMTGARVLGLATVSGRCEFCYSMEMKINNEITMEMSIKNEIMLQVRWRVQALKTIIDIG